ncbi:MAG: DUF5606 domain-containing protein [Muribaculaceae bacterium]
MLKKILSVSGKPGLFKLISYGKNLIVIECIADGKRVPAYSNDKIISLGDIAIYTDTTEVPLGVVLKTIYTKFDGKPLNAKEYNTPESLRNFFQEILPAYDKERVYNNDIKKIISWYNILINAGITDFSNDEEQKDNNEEQKAEK